MVKITSSAVHDKKLSPLETNVDIIKLTRNTSAKSDHRDRPDSEFSEQFKRRVASAASVKGAKLAWVGLRFNVLPETIKSWCKQFSQT